jgi:hypothetical protein
MAGETCSICLNHLRDPIRLSCGHRFGAECLRKAIFADLQRGFHLRCPLCRNTSVFVTQENGPYTISLVDSKSQMWCVYEIESDTGLIKYRDMIRESPWKRVNGRLERKTFMTLESPLSVVASLPI